jgi:hypothetical protein
MPGLTAEAPARAVGRYQLDTEVAHARSGDRIAIAAYLGGSDVFDRAIARFAAAYADQNERDYQALTDAAKSGRITAEHGL